MAEFDPVEILRVLTEHGVRFVVIGGVAARLRGAPLLTQELDVTPDDEPSNLVALAAALRQLEARLRVSDDPGELPFPVEPEMLAAARSWTLSTRAGDLDLILLPAGTRGYPDLVRGASPVRVANDPPLSVPVASLDDVIRNKEATGRDKDRAALPLLRKTAEEIGRLPG